MSKEKHEKKARNDAQPITPRRLIQALIAECKEHGIRGTARRLATSHELIRRRLATPTSLKATELAAWPIKLGLAVS